MISELVAALHNVNPALTAEEISDAIWLARYMRKDDSSGSDATLPRLSDSVATTNSSDLFFPQPKPEELLPNPTSLSTSSDLYLTTHQNGEGKGSVARGLPFRSPAAPALLDALGLARALRPFKRRVPSRTSFTLNEAATAERIAEAGIWMPVLEFYFDSLVGGCASH